MKKVRCVPIVSVRLTSRDGTTKIVSSCENAIRWWSKYKVSEWAAKYKAVHVREPDSEKYRKRWAKYLRRCRPYFENIFGVR